MMVDDQCSMWQCMRWLGQMFVALPLHTISLQSQLLNNDLCLENKPLLAQKVVWKNTEQVRDALHWLFGCHICCCMLSRLHFHTSKLYLPNFRCAMYQAAQSCQQHQP